jgi:1-acyl-sn-glycerol-3-phosphate acyltransferase
VSGPAARLIVAATATVAALCAEVSAIHAPPWWVALGAGATLFVWFGALELALAALAGPSLGLLWCALLVGHDDLRYTTAGLAAGALVGAFLLAGRVAAFRSRPTRASTCGMVAALGAAAAACLMAAQHGAAAAAAPALPALGALLVTPTTCDVLLFRNNTRGTPRLRHLASGVFGFVWVIGLQIVLAAAAFLLRACPGDRLARVRRLGRRGLRAMFRVLPCGRGEWIDVAAVAFAEPCVVVSNHQSAADIAAVLALPVDLRLTISQRVWRQPWLGFTARRLGHVLVERDRFDATLERCRTVFTEGAAAHFFPEGTRASDARVHRFRRGAFDVAVALQKRVVPVVLCDTRSLVPRDAIWVGDHRFSVRVLPALTPGASAHDLMKETQARVRAAFDEELARLNTAPVLRRKAARYYHYQGWRAARTVRQECRALPDPAMLRALPAKGRALDLGCGYGLLAHAVNELRPGLEIVGVDGDPDAIRVARRSATGKDRLSFLLANPMTVDLPRFDAVITRDPALAAHARTLLSPGGVLVSL